MPGIIWPEAILRAYFDTWIDASVMLDEEREERIVAFSQRWGGLSVNTFKQALQRGNEQDRLYALFALGYLAPVDMAELLVPFLYSSVRKERWASAIVLGRSKDERAFALLQEMLVEDLEYHPPPAEEDIMSAVFEAIRQVQGQSSVSNNYISPVHPTLPEIWSGLEVYNYDYEWHLIRRPTIASLLGAWGDPRAVPVLRQAMRKCWQIEQLPLSQGRFPPRFLETCYNLEDELAYALGQLEAWDALDGLGLPPTRFKLARLYLICGSLQFNLRSLPEEITMLISIGNIDPDRVIEVLRERYALDEYLARANLKMFQQWHSRRG